MSTCTAATNGVVEKM